MFFEFNQTLSPTLYMGVGDLEASAKDSMRCWARVISSLRYYIRSANLYIMLSAVVEVTRSRTITAGRGVFSSKDIRGWNP